MIKLKISYNLVSRFTVTCIQVPVFSLKLSVVVGFELSTCIFYWAVPYDFCYDYSAEKLWPWP
jgi:hypothetical protein